MTARAIPHDPMLPGLAELFPATGLPAAVARAAGLEADAPASVRYVRYRPGKGCVVLWAAGDRLVSARLFAVGHEARVADRSSFRRLARTVEARLGRHPFRLLPEHRLLVQLFPLDARLPGLPFACSPDAVGRVTGRRLDAARPVSYKPWKRCVLRYGGPGGGLIGKVFRDDRGAAMPGRLESLARRLDADAWTVQRPAGYVADARLLLFEELDGATEGGSLLRAATRDPATRDSLVRAVRDAAAGLAEFRRAAVGGLGLPVVTGRDLLRWLGKDLAALERVEPVSALAIERELASLEDELRRLPAERLALAHGAFRHDQMLVRGDRLAVVDYDGLRLAGEAADPGNFLGYLDATPVRRPRLAGAVHACEVAFLAGLEGQAIDARSLAWHRKAARVKCALRAVFALAPGWPGIVARLLAAEAPTGASALAGR